MAADYTEIRDFIVLHSRTTARVDKPFRRKRADMEWPDSLKGTRRSCSALPTLREGLDELFLLGQLVLGAEGMGIRLRIYHPLVDLIDEAMSAVGSAREQLAGF